MSLFLGEPAAAAGGGRSGPTFLECVQWRKFRVARQGLGAGSEITLPG